MILLISNKYEIENVADEILSLFSSLFRLRLVPSFSLHRAPFVFQFPWLMGTYDELVIIMNVNCLNERFNVLIHYLQCISIILPLRHAHAHTDRPH